jgi:hypothetical protein
MAGPERSVGTNQAATGRMREAFAYVMTASRKVI